MIKNEHQRRITQTWVKRFAASLEALHASRSDQAEPWVAQLNEDALRSQLASLQGELAEYDALRSGRRKVLSAESFDDLPAILIQARIAKGLTQEELASRVGLKKQQIQKYEASDYAMVSMERVQAIINALEIGVREEIRLYPKTSRSAIAPIQPGSSATTQAGFSVLP
ncbi:MAG TPA: helix-turn-helix transcriptional regulator [Armatimonadota bacterium]|jgi:HTH-type transcriptional regulator/antitoxin HigA